MHILPCFLKTFLSYLLPSKSLNIVDREFYITTLQKHARYLSYYVMRTECKDKKEKRCYSIHLIFLLVSNKTIPLHVMSSRACRCLIRKCHFFSEVAGFTSSSICSRSTTPFRIAQFDFDLFIWSIKVSCLCFSDSLDSNSLHSGALSAFC